MKSNFSTTTLLLLLFAFSLVSCKKDLEKITDCLGEATALKFDHSISSTNTKLATLTVMYSGSFTLQNTVQWDFGDGNKLATSMTTTTHTYSAAGTYTAKAKVTIKKGGETCEFETTETIVIN